MVVCALVMISQSAPLGPIVLEPAFQNYAWGDTRFIPELFGISPSGSPYAEAWFGAHPANPSTANVDGRKVPLDRAIEERPGAILGSDLAGRSPNLPFMLKVLAAARPLSVQAHPSGAQARAGFRRENAAGIPLTAANRNYRDPNAKPELIVALSRFVALCGFRRTVDIARALEGVPELTPLLPDWQGAKNPLRTLVESYFDIPPEKIQPALARWVRRLTETSPAAGSLESWILEAARTFASAGGVDRGLFFYLLLNVIELEPGEALFLAAGTPHAYQRGAAIEVMSNSDNVLRAGLTTKHVDTGELLSILRFESRLPPVLRPSPADGGETKYLTPADSFVMHVRDVGEGDRTARHLARGPELLLFMADEPRATLDLESASNVVSIPRYGCCLVPDGTEYCMRATNRGRVVRIAMPTADQLTTFRERPVRTLSFGTSGLRGLVGDITDLEAYVNTRGFLDYLLEIDDVPPTTPVAVAGDLRPSTDGPNKSILAAVARAVTDAGWPVVACGRIPTPALTSYALSKGWPSIMVTGSHIPFDRNGIKFNKSRGEVLKSDEAGILRAVECARREQYQRPADDSPFDDEGRFRPPGAPRPPETADAREHYVRRYLDFFPAKALAGMRIAVYEHSAVGTALLGDILAALGAEVFPFGRSAEFVAIDTEDISDARLSEMQVLADQTRSRFGKLHAIVSTDGDSDRPLLLDVEESGRVRFFTGDLIGILVADYLGADALAVPVTASDAIDRHFANRSVRMTRTRVGSPFVIAAATALEGRRRVGWEANGGFLTFSELEREGRRLAPLPTRDAVLPLLSVLHLANEKRVRIGELFGALPPRYGASGLIDGVPTQASRLLGERIGAGDPGVVMASFSGGKVRAVDADGRDRETPETVTQRLESLRAWLEERFGSALGFGKISKMGFLDGTRIWFDSGDVVHIRPSGNAPQLRIYALADSEKRARSIVAMAIRDNDGILQTLLAEASSRGV